MLTMNVLIVRATTRLYHTVKIVFSAIPGARSKSRLERYNTDRVQSGLSKRAVLRTGYAAVIAVLVLSAVEAYSIQSSVSEQNLVIYRHYVDQDKALRILRFNVWQAGNYVRDFFIVSTPAQADRLRNQLRDLKAEDDHTLQFLDKDAGRGDAIPKLRKSLGEFWNVAGAVPESMLHGSDEDKFAFLQREIVPRRGQLYNAMLDLTAADEQKLEEGERDFRAARRRGGLRLTVMRTALPRSGTCPPGTPAAFRPPPAGGGRRAPQTFSGAAR